MIKIDYIKEYLVLAETLSFSRTAELTYITQPALSRHIAAIEEEMGGTLFDRTTHSVALTPAGEAVRYQFQAIMQSYRTAQEQTELLSAGKSGVLMLDSPYYWTEEFAEPVILALEERNPGIDVRVRSVQPLVGISDVLEGECDIVLCIETTHITSDVRRVPFAREPLDVAMLDDHPLAGRTSLRLDDLKGERFVTIVMDTSDYGNYNTFVLDLLDRHGIHPDQFSYTEQVDTLGLTLRKKGGVSVMTSGVRHMDRSYLRFIPLEDEDAFVPMCLYYRVDNTNPLIPKYVQIACEIGGSLGARAA